MPAAAVSSRPQTLRQARRAYQKAGAKPRLSEIQIRQLERSAELQERADRIKEREYRRKANLKRKNEKIEREREARTRMGIPSPVKEDVGASQMRLGAFLIVGLEANTRCEGIQNQPLLSDCSQKLLEEGPPASAQGHASARSPLQPRSGNEATRPPSSRTTPEAKALKPSRAMLPSCCPIQKSSPPVCEDSEKQPVNAPARSSNHCLAEPLPEQTVLPSKCAQIDQISAKAPARRPNGCPTKSHPEQTSQTPKTAQMLPPPLPMARSMSKTTPKRISKPPGSAPLKPQPVVDEWAAFLVSNTQIEREICVSDTTNPVIATNKSSNLSTTIAPSLFLTQSGSDPASTPCPAPASATRAAKRKSSTEDLLAQISTQDLQYVVEVEQKASPNRTIAEKEKREPEFGDDITDVDLEEAVLQVEQAATPKQENCVQLKRKENDVKPKQIDSFYDDGFDISTQELRDLVD